MPPASVLAELCLPLVRVGGVWVAQKGADVEQEVRLTGQLVKHPRVFTARRYGRLRTRRAL